MFGTDNEVGDRDEDGDDDASPADASANVGAADNGVIDAVAGPSGDDPTTASVPVGINELDKEILNCQAIMTSLDAQIASLRSVRKKSGKINCIL